MTQNYSDEQPVPKELSSGELGDGLNFSVDQTGTVELSPEIEDGPGCSPDQTGSSPEMEGDPGCSPDQTGIKGSSPEMEGDPGCSPDQTDTVEVSSDDIYIDPGYSLDVTLNSSQTDDVDISFCGCGFLGIYHIGVATSLFQNGGDFVHRLKRYAGASAGSLAAVALATMPDKLDKCRDMIYNMAKETRSKTLGALTPGFNLSSKLHDLLDDLLPPDAHQLASNKLHISVTSLHGKKNRLISNFDTREELIQALLCSCHIPYYMGRKFPRFQGQKYMDGGYTDNLPQFNDASTVKVSPFSGKQDVCPQDENGTNLYTMAMKQFFKLSAQNIWRTKHALFPPDFNTLKMYYKCGYQDAKRFLQKNRFSMKKGNLN
ncbi:patatin-like phospholipase domain-containing protein 4 [Glandiceps talaboti]